VVKKQEGNENVYKKKRCILASFFFGLILILTFGGFSFKPSFVLFYFNTTASLPRGFYLILPSREPFEIGDYVVYEPTPETKALALSRHWLQDDELLLKKIGAMPYNKYVVDPHTLQFYANGKYIGQVFLSDRMNLPMPVLRGEYEVPDGEFLPVGDNPRSFDGRYTGTVPIKNIKSKVIPIVTEFHL